MKRGMRKLVGLIGAVMMGLGAKSQAPGWEMLMQKDDVLRGQVIATEQVLDLVDAWVADSVVEKRKQRLAGVGGWIAQRTAARYWLQYDSLKQKYIASNSRPYHVFNGVGDEIDINIFLMPHLPRYVNMVKEGFDLALARNRNIDGFRFDQPEGFPVPEELKFEDRGYLSVECEVTANQEFAGDLEGKFMPISGGTFSLDTMPNFGTKFASMGMTGAWCMDCNHNCRPEIHPIEWLWWLDLSPERPGGPEAKSWMVSLLVDDSRRFKDWSPSPIAGEITLPFIVPQNGRSLDIDIDWIAGDPVDAADSIWQNGPATALPFADTTYHFMLDAQQDFVTQPVQLHIEGCGSQPNLRAWTSGPFVPAGSNTVAGYLHISAFTTTMAAMRVTIQPHP